MHASRRLLLPLATLVAAVALAGAAAPSTAADKTRKLVGDYAVNATLNCTTSDAGFDPETLVRLGNGSTFSASLQGVASLDGRGGMTQHAEVLVIPHDAGGAPGQYEIQCSGSYTVSDDLMMESSSDCLVFRKTPGGPLPPGVPTLLTGSALRGRLFGAKRNMIMLRSSTEPGVETISVPLPGGGSMYLMNRICANAGTAVRIWN